MCNNIVKYILIIVFILLPKVGLTSDTILYFGTFLNAPNKTCIRSYPEDIGYSAKYIAGIFIKDNIFRSTRTEIHFYADIETIIDNYNGNCTFHPSSIKYTIGVEAKLNNHLTIDISHMCWHPVDRHGAVEQYNLLKIKYRISYDRLK